MNASVQQLGFGQALAHVFQLAPGKGGHVDEVAGGPRLGQVDQVLDGVGVVELLNYAASVGQPDLQLGPRLARVDFDVHLLLW